ncbi:helix-turn-helix domain-containing protein [Lentilactobacillus otakiensis]|uniref:helix-turn-helix domain-containing protein n=1 Tax=Lentilactobacillus otakiensis TaxID=481720 RepID=UPI003D17DA61
MDFGTKIKEARQDQSLTQNEVAGMLHVSRKTISSWETGRSYPDIETLVQLSDIYQITIDTLLREDLSMINHYKKQSTAVHYSVISGSVSYYLNIFLLLLTLLNFTNLFNANLKYAPLLLIFNLAFLLSYFDSHRFSFKKIYLSTFIVITGFVIALIAILIHQPAANFAEGLGEAIGVAILTTSFLLAVFGKPYIKM